MKRTAKIIVLASVISVGAFVWAMYLLFHGAFDHGTFEVEQTQSFSSRQLAVVAKRSDHEALSGDQYFVVIGDHPLSSVDLKYAYYHDGVAFRAGRNCLTVRWTDVHELTVTCMDNSIIADEIAVQRNQIGYIKVVYENIPMISKK